MAQGKYQYLRLPMGVNVSPDVFQEKMSSLMQDLEYVRTYLDDLLVISNGSFEEHLQQLGKVLQRLRRAGLKINAEKSSFFAPEIEYLGYLLTKDGIKPVQKKIQAVLDLQPPTTLKELRSFLGMVQFYRDMWKQRSHILAPLTDLVGLGKKKIKWRKGSLPPQCRCLVHIFAEEGLMPTVIGLGFVSVFNRFCMVFNDFLLMFVDFSVIV